MKIKIEAQYLARSATQGKKDPSKTYFSALFMQGTDTLQLNCTTDAYNALERVQPMSPVILDTDYNVQYKYFQLTDIAVKK